jgi:dipeptidyl-peptidase-4
VAGAFARAARVYSRTDSPPGSILQPHHHPGHLVTLRPLLLVPTLAVLCAAPGFPQQADSSLLTLGRIYGSQEFAPDGFGPARWLDSGAAYTTLEPADDGKGADIVRYEVEKGSRTVMVPARTLIPQGDSLPLEVEDYSWSPDGNELLVFTNTRPV